METETTPVAPVRKPAASMRAARAIVDQHEQQAGGSDDPPPGSTASGPDQASRAPDPGARSFQETGAGPLRLLGSIDTLTVPAEDGQSYEVRHANSGRLISRGGNAGEAQGRAQDLAGWLGRRRLTDWLQSDAAAPPSQPPPRDAAGGAISQDTQDMLDTLQYYADGKDREGYWNYLASKGVPYARLALGVVRNDTLSGYVANNYAALRAGEKGVHMNEAQWNKIGVDLMNNDLARRRKYAKPGQEDKVLQLPVRDIAKYHADTFTHNGLDAMAWTPTVVLQPYLDKGDDANAERVFKDMMDPDFFVKTGSSIRADAANLSWANKWDHALWLAKVGALSGAYAADGGDAYGNTDRIAGWQYAGDHWYHPELYSAGSSLPGGVTAPPGLREELDADREFRRARQQPRPRAPLDRSATIPSL